VKGLRVAISFLITSFVMGFALALLSAYLVAHGEHPIPPTSRLTMIFGLSGIVAAIAGARGGNRRVAHAAAGQEAEAKRCASLPDRATVYVFRDAYFGKLAGLDVLLDGAPVGQTRGKTFYRLELAPGEHRLASRNPRDGSQHEHRLYADSGSLVFLEQRVSMGATTMKHQIVPTEHAAAVSRIQRCRLLVPAPAGVTVQ
jgi:hypothetical protein